MYVCNFYGSRLFAFSCLCDATASNRRNRMQKSPNKTTYCLIILLRWSEEMQTETDVWFNACPRPSPLSAYQPPPQVCCKVWKTLTEVCAEPDPWNWCWELDRVSSLSARSVWCERDAATRRSIYSASWGAIFPDELSQIPTAGSLRPSVLSRLCDYLDWLRQLIISPPCIIARLPPPIFCS